MYEDYGWVKIKSNTNISIKINLNQNIVWPYDILVVNVGEIQIQNIISSGQP